MKICLDSKDILLIAEQIQHNCNMLSYTDAEDAEDDVDFYVPVIHALADDLQALVELKVKQEAEHINAKSSAQEAI